MRKKKGFKLTKVCKVTNKNFHKFLKKGVDAYENK